MTTSCLLIFAMGLAYAIIRYIVLGAVSLDQLPAYIMNKALALSAATTLFISAFNYAKNRPQSFQSWAVVSFGFAAGHILLSLALWSREYYPKLFGVSKMNLAGELTLLFGVLNASFYGAVSVFKRTKLYSLRWLAAAMLSLHVLPLGFSGWFAVNQWPGGLPPISLLSFFLAIISLVFFTRSRPANCPWF